MITKELLLILLNKERSEQDRLKSLQELRDYLDQEDIITSLAALAEKEQSIVIRKALLKIIVEAEITNIKNKESFLKILFHFSCMEKEEKLRLIAVKRLSDLAFQNEQIELVLAENLLYDASREIQKVCLLGLQKTGCEHTTTLEILSLYTQKINDVTIEPFIGLLTRIPADQSERICIDLLHPLNNNDVKVLAIKELAKYPKLQATTIAYIFDILLEDNENGNLAESILLLLSTREIQDLSIVDTIIKNLKVNPQSKTKLLPLLKRLIMASPAVVDKVKTLYKDTDSIFLKTTILTSLNETEALDIAIEALKDSNLQIRYQGLQYCRENIEKDTQHIIQTMLDVIRKEPDAHLRTSLAREISKVNYLDETSEKMLLAYYNEEDSPWVIEELVKTLFLIPLRDDNKQTVLEAYIKTLVEVFFPDDLKDYVIDQLGNFSNTNTPKLAQCLVKLMLQEFDIKRVGKLYRQYSQLEHKDDEPIELVLLLFERFVHFYPHEQLKIWAKELKHKTTNHELVREKAEFLAQITRDHSFLVNKGSLHITSPLIDNIIASIRQGQNRTAGDILQDAYRNRKIKKEEITLLFKRLLQGFDNTGLIYQILDILKEQQLMTVEIVELALNFIADYPDSSLSNSLQSMLNSMGKILPEYAQYLQHRITSNNYTSYGLKTYQVRAEYDLQWNNNWRNICDNWIFGKLWSDLYPEVSFLKFFNTKSDTKFIDNQSLDYYILRKFSRIRIKKEELVGNQTIYGEEVLLTIGNKIEQLEPDNLPGSFYDRILYVFSEKWKEFIVIGEQPSLELSQCATKIYYTMFKRWKNYQGRVSHELLSMPLWLDFNLMSELIKKDAISFSEFFKPYYELIKTEAKHKIQNNSFPNREQPPQYRVAPAFNFLSLNNYISSVTDFIITSKWSEKENEKQVLKESLHLIRKVWKATNGDVVMTRLKMTTEDQRNEILKWISN